MSDEIRLSIPNNWKRMGLALARNKTNFIGTLAQKLIIKSIVNNINLPIPEKMRKHTATGRPGKKQGFIGTMVMGDPCIVWDEEIGAWRMFLFALLPGHGQAVCQSNELEGLTKWQFQGPLIFSNVDQLLGESAYKPFVVMDGYHPNQAAKINGQYCLLIVTNHKAKFIQRAWAKSLAGPWHLESKPLISVGKDGDFDAKHIDAVTGYYFAERNEILYFYMGYPIKAQNHQLSPYGSSQATAVENVEEGVVRKQAIILPPNIQKGHWASGWVGGLQLLPGREHKWIAIVNASPTAPDPKDTKISKEEPPPSLGGFAFCDQDWPISGWQWADQPIEWIENVPKESIQAGEKINFWRHHILVLPNNQLALFYNCGDYFQEQIYLKYSI